MKRASSSALSNPDALSRETERLVAEGMGYWDAYAKAQEEAWTREAAEEGDTASLELARKLASEVGGLANQSVLLQGCREKPGKRRRKVAITPSGEPPEELEDAVVAVDTALPLTHTLRHLAEQLELFRTILKQKIPVGANATAGKRHISAYYVHDAQVFLKYCKSLRSAGVKVKETKAGFKVLFEDEFSCRLALSDLRNSPEDNCLVKWVPFGKGSKHGPKPGPSRVVRYVDFRPGSGGVEIYIGLRTGDIERRATEARLDRSDGVSVDVDEGEEEPDAAKGDSRKMLCDGIPVGGGGRDCEEMKVLSREVWCIFDGSHWLCASCERALEVIDEAKTFADEGMQADGDAGAGEVSSAAIDPSGSTDNVLVFSTPYKRCWVNYRWYTGLQ